MPVVTVIVPARNEAAGIAACAQGVRQSTGVTLRVIVVDDASTDATASIVESMAVSDARVSLLRATSLPAGWNGKQHACWLGAQAADSPVLCFLDADVRLHPEALHRMATLLVHGDGRSGPPDGRRTGLVSGFPKEETGTALEWLLLPLIHFVLLGLLPMKLLRTTTSPGVAAGCGQFLMVDRESYFAAGGHAAIRETMHDGLRLPRLLRAQGYGTRLADLTELAACRMYRSSAATWHGLSKNATEGLGAPSTIVPMTLLLGAGQVLPLPLLLWGLVRATAKTDLYSTGKLVACVAVAGAATAMSYLPRILERRRFHQRRRSAALHPVGVAVLLALQWYALGRKLMRRPATWKAREYAAN